MATDLLKFVDVQFFANENVGTIKQRAPAAKPSLVMIYDDGRPRSGDSDTVFNSDNQDTLKRTPNKLPKPQPPHMQQLQQQDLHRQLQQQQQTKSGHLHQQNMPSYSASVTATIAPGTQTQPSSNGPVRPAVPQKPVKPAVSPKPTQKGKGRSGDVLSEIDNMLQGLTDELDAMLEVELTE